MSLTRSELEHLSLYYYIKEGVLSKAFSQEVQGEPLTYDTTLYDGIQRKDYRIVDPSSGAFGKMPVSRGRGWLSFDPGSANPCKIYNSDTNQYVSTYNTEFFNHSYSIPTLREQNSIVVRDQYNNVMDREWYQIDYENGRIRYPAPTTPAAVVSSGTNPTTIDYGFHLVSVLDGWLTDEEVPETPLVVIYPETEDLTGFQLGGGIEFTRKYTIEVFGTSTSNRRSILNTIQQGLYNKHSPVIDFNRSGQPLKHWGLINKDFIQDITYAGSTYRSYLTLNGGNGEKLYFFNIEVTYDTSPRNTMSDTLRHRGKIRLTTRSFSDRDPDLVGKFSGLNEPPGGFDSLITRDYSS